jgi:CRISPR-associated protein Csb1
MEFLTLLKNALAGSVAGVRRRVGLQPAGGESAKVFPPTYKGAPYAFEDRVVSVKGDNGQMRASKVLTVLLDSVQSQANRMELALLEGRREDDLEFPLIEVDFSECPDLSDLTEINSLTAPHRIFDAILRDSFLGKDKFRDSEVGRQVVSSSPRNATSMWEVCPTALIFGAWDSTGQKGQMGVKFPRALSSEIVGFACVKGVRAGVRRDPLGIEVDGIPVYAATEQVAARTQFDWTLDEKEAASKDGKPVLYKEGKPTELNHSNILVGTYHEKTGTFRKTNGEEIHGGVTISHAVQTTVLSFPALRRLNFPVAQKENESDSEFAARQRGTNLAARTVLVALALVSVALNEQSGYDLRSGCLLVPEGPGTFEWLNSHASAKTFSLDVPGAKALLNEAIEEARRFGLKWNPASIRLKPSDNLQTLIRLSRAKAAAAPA